MKYNSYESIKDLYYQYFTNFKPFEDSGYDNNESDKFSFGLNNYLYFYIEMHKMSGSAEWLTLMEETCAHILDNTDIRRVEKGEIVITPLEDPQVDTNYFQAPYPYLLNGTPVEGWSSFDGSPRPRLRVQCLQDGQIVAALCSVAHYIKENNLSESLGFSDNLLSYSRSVIESHDRSYKYGSVVDGLVVAGTYKYPNRLTGEDGTFGDPLPYNHNAGMLKAAMICSNYLFNQEYMDKAENFIQFLRDTREEVDGRFKWLYSFTVAGKCEDVNHGSYTLDMLLTAKELNLFNVTDEELIKYSNAFVHTNKWPRVNEAYEKIDATGDMPVSETFCMATISKLGYLNKDLLTLARDLSSTNYVIKYHLHFYAIASLLNTLQDFEL